MNLADRDRVQSWLDKWQDSHGNERANYQTFFQDWCILGVESPPPKGKTKIKLTTKEPWFPPLLKTYPNLLME